MTDILRIPRYIRNSDAFGWQGANDPNGPWRSISPPQIGTPFQTTNPMDDLRQASAEVSGIEVLSPVAQEVLDAVKSELDHAPWELSYLAGSSAAAALRAAADHIEHHWDGAECVDHLQSLAAELEGGHG